MDDNVGNMYLKTLDSPNSASRKLKMHISKYLIFAFKYK